MIERRDTMRTLSRNARHATPKASTKIARGAFNTLPFLLVGSMAVSLNITGPIGGQIQKNTEKPKDSNSQLRQAIRAAMAQQAQDMMATASDSTTGTDAGVARLAPASYRVAGGDTVSGIAARYGLATASVLALNGLGWKSIIFPGQVLRLGNGASPQKPAAPAPTTSSRYIIVSGDTIGGIAARFSVTTQAILTANGLGWSSIIYPGQRIAIPGHAGKPTQGPTPPSAPPVTIVPVFDVTPIAPVPVRYVIKPGDTIEHIAARFGVSQSSIFAANSLTRTSIIYVGRTLIIRGPNTSSAGFGDAIAILTPDMEANARTILSVGRSLGVPKYGLVIALAAAMQESTLRNLNYGDRDSLGLFQQRPSTGWGAPAKVRNTVYASKLFFGGPANPNKGNTKGLLDIAGWQSMTLTRAAQAVQRSAYPDAYAKWEVSARAWLKQLS
ncbi:MAG: LysM peptidoglycan-binding domain-containing protein [Terrimesophilobacter sp.]